MDKFVVWVIIVLLVMCLIAMYLYIKLVTNVLSKRIDGVYKFIEDSNILHVLVNHKK